jgi:hypothetical protein
VYRLWPHALWRHRNLPDYGIDAGGVPPGQKYLSALRCKLLGNCGANGTAGTKNNRYLALQHLGGHGDLRVSLCPIDVRKAWRRTLPNPSPPHRPSSQNTIS